MKKIINTAPMAVVTTLHTPQTLLLTLRAASGTLTQAQDITQNLWSPDRTLTPLVIESVFSAYDPDTKSRASAAASLKWYVNDVEIQTTATSSDYYRVDTATGGIKAGSLVVRKNVSYTTPVTIRCEATYQGRTEKAEVVLTSENKPDVFYTLDLMTPNVVKYRPLEDALVHLAFNDYGPDAFRVRLIDLVVCLRRAPHRRFVLPKRHAAVCD